MFFFESLQTNTNSPTKIVWYRGYVTVCDMYNGYVTHCLSMKKQGSALLLPQINVSKHYDSNLLSFLTQVAAVCDSKTNYMAAEKTGTFLNKK